MSRETPRRTNRLLIGLAFSGLAVATVAMLRAQDSYVRPRPGWLYVVASDPWAKVGSVLVVDPDQGRVVSRITRSYQPDLAVSPDGSRLYLSYVYEEHGHERGVMEVVDATTGATLYRADDADPWASRGMAYTSRMALSRDGQWLYRYKDSQSSRSGYIEVFDTTRNAVLAASSTLQECDPAALLPGPDRRTLHVVCAASQDVQTLTFNSRGAAAKPRRVDVDGGRFGDQVTAFLSADDQALVAVKGDGRFFKIDAATGQLLHKDTVDRAARGTSGPNEVPGNPEIRSATDWLAGRQLMRQPPVLSPDGSRAYLLIGRGEDTHASGRRDHVVALNTDTLERAQTIALSRPCVSLTISRDGRQLYAIDTLNNAVLVIEAATGRELKVIPDVGPRPVFAIVAQ